jgi:hypothetical protein
VDVSGRAFEIAKEFGDIEAPPQFSKDNRWIIKTRNGEVLEEPLQKLFEARLGSDPAVQAMYKTEAYVNRKMFAKANAAQFDGDESKAEMQYLQDKFNILKLKNQAQFQQMQEQDNVYGNRIKDIQSQIDAGNKDPKLKMQLVQYQMNKDINKQVLDRVEKENETLNTSQSGDEFQNPYGDIKSLRFKVDMGMASALMETKLGEAAHTYAYRNYKSDLTANPYQVNDEKFSQNMSLLNARLKGEQKLADYKAGLKAKIDANKAKVDAGTHHYDENGQVVENFNMNHFFTKNLDKGTAVERINLRSENENVQRKYTQNYALPYFKTMLTTLTDAVNSKTGAKLTQKQINFIINGNENKKADLVYWTKQLQNNPNNFLADQVGTKWMQGINNRFKTFVQNNAHLSTVSDKQAALTQSATKFDDYILFLDASKNYEKSLVSNVEKQLKSQGLVGANLLYDNDGNIRSEKEYLKALYASGQLSKEDMAYIKKFKQEAADRAALNKAIDNTQSFNPLMDYLGKIGNKALVNMDRVGPGNWLDMWIEHKLDKNNYNELLGAANKIVTSNAKVSEITGKKSIPGIEKFSEGTGIYAKGQYTTINPRSSWGTYHFSQAMEDIMAQDPGGITITTGGAGITGSKDGKLDTEQGLAFMRELQSQMAQGKKGFNFDMGIIPIALNSPNKAAYNFQPSVEFLKSFMQDKLGNGGIFSQEQAALAFKNGITFIMDKKAFNSDMFNSIYKDPLASYVDYQGAYEWSDPTNPDYTIKIENSLPGLGQYKMSGKYPVFDQNSNSWVNAEFSYNVDNASSNLGTLRDDIIFNSYELNRKYNNQLVNGY